MTRDELRTRIAHLGDPTIQMQWRGIQEAGGVPSPFLSWQWNNALGASPAAAATAYVITAEKATGEVLGLLPVEWWNGSRRLRTVGVAGWHWLSPDHLDVVAAAANRAAVAAAVMRHLSSSRWDVLDLDGLAPGGALAAAASDLHLPRHFRKTPEPVPAPWVDLTHGPEPTSVLPSRNLRQQVSRGTRAAGGLSVITDPDAVAAALPLLMSLHNARFGARSVVFATPERRRFHLVLARALAADGLARVYKLGTADREAALLYALVWGQCIYYYSMGLNSELGRSPGLSVLGAAILSAAQEGFSEFDLLRGDHAFKLRFATGTRTDLRLRVVRPTVRVATVAGARVWRRLGSATRLQE